MTTSVTLTRTVAPQYSILDFHTQKKKKATYSTYDLHQPPPLSSFFPSPFTSCFTKNQKNTSIHAPPVLVLAVPSLTGNSCCTVAGHQYRRTVTAALPPPPPPSPPSLPRPSLLSCYTAIATYVQAIAIAIAIGVSGIVAVLRRFVSRPSVPGTSCLVGKNNRRGNVAAVPLGALDTFSSELGANPAGAATAGYLGSSVVDPDGLDSSSHVDSRPSGPRPRTTVSAARRPDRTSTPVVTTARRRPSPPGRDPQPPTFERQGYQGIPPPHPVLSSSAMSYAPLQSVPRLELSSSSSCSP